LPDLIMCIGRERNRFDEELHRMLAYEARVVVVEAPKSACLLGTPRSKVHPNAIEGSLIGWNGQIHIEFVENPTQAARYVSWFLWVHTKRRWQESKFLLKGMEIRDKRSSKDQVYEDVACEQ
jgi:DNA excision repair protein ERCC-4